VLPLAKLALLFSTPVLLVLLQPIPAFANHENINVYLNKGPYGLYLHGEQVTTTVEIHTGIFGGHRVIDDQNSSSYYVEFTDRLSGHSDVPVRVEPRQLFVRPITEDEPVRNNFTRPFIEGYWVVSVKVWEDDKSGELIEDWNETIVVQPAITGSIQKQADAAQNASIYTPLASLGAGAGAAVLGMFTVLRIEKKKGRQETNKRLFAEIEDLRAKDYLLHLRYHYCKLKNNGRPCVFVQPFVTDAVVKYAETVEITLDRVGKSLLKGEGEYAEFFRLYSIFVVRAYLLCGDDIDSKRKQTKKFGEMFIRLAKKMQGEMENPPTLDCSDVTERM
jgi:hypothetical protein